MRNIYDVLSCWGAWAASISIGISWKPIAAGFRESYAHKKGRMQCSDDEGMIIGRCVGVLKKYKIEEYNLLVEHFVLGSSLRSIARTKKCSDAIIRKNLAVAMSFLEACLYIQGVK